MGMRAPNVGERLIGTVMLPGNDLGVAVMVGEKLKWQQEAVQVGFWQVAS